MATDPEPTLGADERDPGPRDPGPRGPAFRRRDVTVLVVLLAAVGVVLALIIRGHATTKPLGSATVRSSRYAGLAITPKPAPALALRNYLGSPVNIAAYRGKALLVTFLYTHCPDVCPLIVSMLHTALVEMPQAERRQLQIIAVSVDPRGDTPAAVAQFLSARKMTAHVQYLIGSATQLGEVWRHWDVASKRAAATPEVVAHTALIYGITASGKIAVVYPANFAPSQIVHDVPRLAGA